MKRELKRNISFQKKKLCNVSNKKSVIITCATEKKEEP